MDPKQKQFSIWYILLALWALLLFQLFLTPFLSPTEIPYSEFKEALQAGQVEEVSISENKIQDNPR